MSSGTVILLLSLGLAFLAAAVLYQQFAFWMGTQAKLRKMSGEIK